MFDRASVPPLPSRLVRMGGGRPAARALLRLGFSIALAATAALTGALPVQAAAADGQPPAAPSIQYQEAVAHASEGYSFSPGGAVTVPFRPRADDSIEVDGMPPVALPAGKGSAAMAPNLTGPSLVTPNTTATSLRREVLGFLPYWELSSTLDYSTISTVAYFGIDLNLDGTLSKAGNGWNGWVSSSMTSVINDAHAHGTRVALTVESFAWDSVGVAAQTALLSSPTASLTAAQQIAAEVGRRGADGVNLDFEPIASGQSANYISFVRTLRVELDKVHAGYELTFCATGRPSTYDLTNLLAAGAADAVFIMGYDFRGGSPATAGSIDPLTNPAMYDLTDAVNAFTAQAPASKIILGLPWYGHAWSTGTVNTLNAPPGDIPTYGAPATGITYASAKALADRDPTTTPCTAGWPQPCVTGWQYDTGEQTAWTAYYGNYDGTQNTWRELYFDNPQALGAKCDAIDAWNLRGVGIWALGYDNNNGDGDLTNTIAARFEVTGSTGSTYVPVTPVRLLDTRVGNGTTGPLSANTPATFQVTGRGGIPATATAVTGNVTVTDETSSWAVYLGPDANPNPSTSTINFKTGDISANGLTVALSATGTLSATYISTAGNTTNLVFDVTGYFSPDPSGATYHPISPARLLDTRSGNGLSAKLSANVPATFQIGGRGGVPANATAVTGNVTVTGETASWAVYLGPVATATPTTSTINFNKGDVKANSLAVGLDSGGKLSATYMSTKGNTTDLVFDVTGYYTADSTGARFTPLAPVRLLDTRSGNGLSGPISANAPATFSIGGRGGVPGNATAVTGNVTVTDETLSWAVSVGPNPDPAPTTSTLNFNTGDVKANGLTVALSTTGTLSATYISIAGNTTDLVLDVTGYFAP